MESNSDLLLFRLDVSSFLVCRYFNCAHVMSISAVGCVFVTKCREHSSLHSLGRHLRASVYDIFCILGGSWNRSHAQATVSLSPSAFTFQRFGDSAIGTSSYNDSTSAIGCTPLCAIPITAFTKSCQSPLARKSSFCLRSRNLLYAWLKYEENWPASDLNASAMKM